MQVIEVQFKFYEDKKKFYEDKKKLAALNTRMSLKFLFKEH
jgi:hypothetical protein